jgi:hypothetical protein
LDAVDRSRGTRLFAKGMLKCTSWSHYTSAKPAIWLSIYS